MKEIMKEHGGIMFTAAVVISVLTIIFSAVTDSDGNCKDHSGAHGYRRH